MEISDHLGCPVCQGRGFLFRIDHESLLCHELVGLLDLAPSNRAPALFVPPDLDFVLAEWTSAIAPSPFVNFSAARPRECKIFAPLFSTECFASAGNLFSQCGMEMTSPLSSPPPSVVLRSFRAQGLALQR